MGGWWHDEIIGQQKLPLLVLFAAFVVTFVVTRTITRMIRAGRGPFKNNVVGGVHIHHSVPGIVLLVTGAFVAVGATTMGWRIGAAVSVGVGTSLVLDEFAMILHLKDVYWSDEGRTSVEMVSLAAACLGFALVGFVPFRSQDLAGSEAAIRTSGIGIALVDFAMVVVSVLKGKWRLALVGCFVPVVAWIGGVRLARPRSRWARRYSPERRAKAEARAHAFDARWDPVFDRLSDIVAGRPTTKGPPAGSG